MSIIVKNLKTKELSYEKKVVLSHFVPFGLKKTIENLSEDSYVLGVGYEKGKENYPIPEDEKYGEFQIGISGHPKVSETEFEGLAREMKEELGLKILKYEKVTKFITNRNNFYSIELSNCSICEDLSLENNEEDKKERVVMIIHGTKEEVLNYLHFANVDCFNTDKINHLWASSRSVLLKGINEMTKLGKFPEWKKVYYTEAESDDIS